MAKTIPEAIQDAQLTLAEGDQISVCSAEATTYTEAITTFKLAIQTGISGEFTKANGDTSGRKSTVAAQSTVDIDSSGTATQVVVTNLGDTTLRRQTTCVPQAFVSGGTVDIGAHKNEIQDPT